MGDECEVVIFGVVAMILVVLGLGYTLLATESNRKVSENLQSKVVALGARVNTLESEKAVVIRINFLSFIPDHSPRWSILTSLNI